MCVLSLRRKKYSFLKKYALNDVDDDEHDDDYCSVKITEFATLIEHHLFAVE
jgi:hypothetical protein